jgi:putative glutamine amidotransferase
VDVTEGSLLSRLIGGGMHAVNSIHHQGIKMLGKGLVAGAVATDGLIEAIELATPADHPFLLGVEWHPEELKDEPSQKIFSAFITAAQEKN